MSTTDSKAEAPESKMPPPGSITWTEIPAINMSRVQKFYEDVFGWTFTPMPSGAGPETEEVVDYVLFAKNDTRGGFLKVSEENHLSAAKAEESGKASVTVTIIVDSIDDALKLVEQAGGKVWKPKYAIPNSMGFAAHFLDSEKNVMGLWSL